ncbi:MAG: GAF domain-containing protein [Candidatus Eisenbacteria bacterium]|nr:GAF domain-containing protein [Candidatus Eisenbacteria bacterium]
MFARKRGSKRDSINRRAWLLWALTFVLVIALTAAVPLLYLPLLNLVRATAEETGRSIDTEYVAVTGLAGLVLLFCLYTVLKQRELNRMRHQLEHEEQEKENVRTRLSELSALFQVSTALNLQLRLDDILEIIVRRVVATLKAQQASIMIYNPASSLLETRASYGLESEFAKNARKRLGEGIAGWVAERKEAVQLDSGNGPGPFDAHFKRNRNITSALSLPLRVGDRCVGVLNVNRINHPENFQNHHRDILQMFAEHVGAVIDRADTMERLGSRTRELEADNLKLSEMNRMKDVFLSTASHELKTPLTSVIAYAELLDDNEARLSRDQKGEFLRRLRAEAGRLLSLIEDILDLSRIESGKLTLKCVSVSASEVVHAAVETTRSIAEKRGIAVSESLASDLPPVMMDEVKMRQVFVNLLVNAVKFSPDAGTIAVETLRDGDFLRVEVRDQGTGIEPEEATHIFELFGQGHGEKDGRRGLGIGLHLVKRITELHGGHVGVNSRPGEGSTFWVRLPMPRLVPVEAESEAERRAA